MFIVPTVPTFRVWIGSASYCGGEAGDAKWRTYRTSPSTSIRSLTLARRNSKSGFPSSGRRFSGDPVMKLSSDTTLNPRWSRASQRCEPMNPAPPETTALGRELALAAADPPVREAEIAHRQGVVDVPTVDHDRAAHR